MFGLCKYSNYEILKYSSYVNVSRLIFKLCKFSNYVNIQTMLILTYENIQVMSKFIIMLLFILYLD